jgi:hypothetical protein
MKRLIARVLAWFLAAIRPADAKDCICRIRGEWHDRQGRPGFRAWDR